MELGTLIIRVFKLLYRLFHRSHPAKRFYCFVVLSCSFYCFAAYEPPYCTNWIQNPPEYDACISFRGSYELDFSDSFVSDTNLGYGIPTTDNSIDTVCRNTHTFCFPSTMSGYSYQQKSLKEASLEDSSSQYNGPFGVELTQDSHQASNKSWSSDYGMFELLNGGIVSCSLNSREGINDAPLLETESDHNDYLSSCEGEALLQQKTTQFLPKNSKMVEPSFFSPNIRIGPTVLDWGQKYMYSPSVASITLENTCNDSILHLYEPFSSDIQFYPFNFSEISLGTGESAVVSFVFFPRCLGLSSAHLILQTSYGGFFVEAKGYATESPYGIQPLLGLEISPGGRLSKNFSLFNSFDETLYVDEITAWISVSLGHNSVETEAVCSTNNIHAFDNILFPIIKDRLVVKSGRVGSPVVAIRPHRNWELSPHGSETLLEIDISVGMEGKVFGALCLHLLSSSQEKSDTVMVPIEAAVLSNSAHDTVGIHISTSLEALTPCDGGATVIIISIRNDASYLSSFVKIVEVADSQIFHIKYVEGLLLFPNTVTQVAIIYCSHLRTKLLDLPPEESNLRDNCKLLVLTNDTTSPQIEIQCENILHICFGDRWLSSIGLEHETKYSESGDLRAGYAARSMQVPPHVKDIETEVDELVLGNWMSQGTTGGMSVLETREVLFPAIQVGSFVHQWITVKNPSEHPVVMQLILNAGEIIDECKGPDRLVRPSSTGNLVLDESTTPTNYGFSVPEAAVTKAFVHPYGRVSLGPIIFYPSDRCGWSGSALIRNNLSGVEWLSLRGFGGSLSLVMLEKSEPIQSLDFDLEMPSHLNLSLPYALLHMREMTFACSRSLVREIYAKNTGDLPLEVLSIRVSGRECGLDGFMVHSCRGFVLEPGESTELLISYQSDFSAAIAHRDLELTLATGIFLLPMKSSFPHDMLSTCKKSMFWMRVKKLFLGFFLLTSVLYVVFCIIFPQTTAHGPLDYLCKGNDNNNIPTTVKNAGKTLLRHNQRRSRLSMSDKMNNLLCSVGKDTTSVGMSQYLMQAPENHEETSQLLDAANERKLPSTVTHSSDTVEASQPGNDLMVKTGKEKGRRRRRKSLSAKVAGVSEVSSSQSGNSTPSSPLSPVISGTSKCNWSLSPEVEQPLESRTVITQEANHHSDNDGAPVSAGKAPVKCRGNNLPSQELLHSTSTRAANKPVEIPSTTLPPPGDPSSSLALTSAVPPYARAPGTKLENKKTVQAQETGHADEYTYDIWGGHFSGLHLLGPSYVAPMKSSPAENNFDSFFVKGPQTLKTISQEG